MAKMNVTRMKEISIDNESVHVAENATIDEVVGSEVRSITIVDPKTGRSAAISRDQFARQVPEWFTTDLTPIEKGREASNDLVRYIGLQQIDCFGTRATHGEPAKIARNDSGRR